MTNRQQLTAVLGGLVALSLSGLACSNSGTSASTAGTVTGAGAGMATGTSATGQGGTTATSMTSGTMTSGTMTSGTMSTATMTTTTVTGTGVGPASASSTGTSMCLDIGAACSSGTQCCQGTCTGGACTLPKCTADGAACTTGGTCCSGACGSTGMCTPLNTTCKTIGNPCTDGGAGALSTQCCSQFCSNGVCAPSSFCRQTGDICNSGSQCCGGNCNITAPSTFGTCGTPPTGPANCGMTDGEVCGAPGTTPQTCGLPCCSRACLPYGPTGVFVCQPASGCHVVGDLCTKDSDCCGGLTGQPPPVCTITAPYVVGVCTNPTGCKPNGDVCKLHGTSCSASCDCCSGNCNQPLNDQMVPCKTDSQCMAGYHCYGYQPATSTTPEVMGDCAQYTCNLDDVGVPRCSYGQCVAAGQACASSADCCNHLPCVPNPGGTPPDVCGSTTCQQACSTCTTNADCCGGLTCILPIGQASGVCGPCNPTSSSSSSTTTTATTTTGTGTTVTSTTGATTSASSSTGSGMCFLYGQACTSASQCCNGVPCDNQTGACGGPTDTCTCHYPIF